MASGLTPSGWVVEPDVVDEREDLPRLTGAQITALNARIAAGSNDFPVGTSVIRVDDGMQLMVQGVGTSAVFAVIGLAPALLAASTGATLVGTTAGTVQSDLDARPTTAALAAEDGVDLLAYAAADAQSILDNALPMQSYTALRAYTGRALGVRITGAGVSGQFWRDASDVASADNGGTIIVDGSGRRWKRLYSGGVDIQWFGAEGLTDDNTAINNAIDAVYLQGVGDVLVTPLPAGRKYLFTSILVKTGVRLKGAGGILKLKDGTLVNAGTTYYLLNNIGHPGAEFVGLTIDGNAANNLLALVADVITCTGANSRAVDNLIYDAPDSGIMFSQAPGSACTGNIIRYARDLGIYVNGANSTDKTQIAASIVHSNVISGAALGGIGIKRGSGYLSVIGNAIDDCGNGMTIEDSGAGVFPERLIVTQNTMRRVGTNYLAGGTALTGIYIARLSNATITDNHCYDCEGYGIYARNLVGVSITGNNVGGNGSGTYQPSLGHSGIVLDDTADGIVDSLIADNTVHDFRARSLHAAAIVRTIIRDNTLIGNVAQDDGSAALHQGLVVLNGATINSKHCKITGNILSGFNDTGINLAGLQLSTVSGNIVDVSTSTASAYALKIGASAISNLINDNILVAVDAAHQLLLTNGTATNMIDSNLMANATGVERFIRRNTGISTPVAVIVPRWEGEIFITTSGGVKIWQAYGATNADWLQLA